MAQSIPDAGQANVVLVPEELPSVSRSRQLRHIASHTSLRVGLIVMALIVLTAAGAPLLTHYDPIVQDPNGMLQPPSVHHLMGTDQFGRDVLTRVLYGGRYTMFASLMVVLIGLLIGSVLGLVGGYFGGLVDLAVMRTMDLLLAFPGILLALAITTILGPGLNNAIIAIGVVSIPTYARVVHAATLRVRGLPYLDSARALGAGSARIIRYHVLPNVVSQVFVLGTIWLGTSALWVAALGFLGLGLQPPTPEWGSILNDGRDFITLAWWVSLFPGLVISLYVISANLIGDGLRDVLDPTLQFER